MTDQKTNTKGRGKKILLWIVGILVAFFVGVTALGYVVGDGDKAADRKAAGVETSAPPKTEEPAKTEEPPKTEEPEAESEPDLGEGVMAAVLAGNGVDSLRELGSTNPGFYIVEVETMDSSTVRVYFQTELSDEDRAQAGRYMLNMTCEANPDLDTVVVRDTSGIDSNHYLGKDGGLPACID